MAYPESVQLHLFFGCSIWKIKLQPCMGTRKEKQKLVQKVQFPQEVWGSRSR